MHGFAEVGNLLDEITKNFKSAVALAQSAIGLATAIYTAFLFFNRVKKKLVKQDKSRAGAPRIQHSFKYPPWPRTAFLFFEEAVIIVSCGVFLNVVCVTFCSQFPSILFLDMLGTAVVSFLLGPWYGAATGLISNMINSLLNIVPDYIPWAVVNMVGGLVWGYFARTNMFRRFITVKNPEMRDWASFLGLFGILSAMVMAIPAPLISEAIIQKSEIVAPTYPVALSLAVHGYFPDLRGALSLFLSGTSADVTAQMFLDWVTQSLLFIPDKIFCIVGAIIVVRAAFPLYSKFLIELGANKAQSQHDYLDPIVLLITMVPYYVTVIAVITGSGIIKPEYRWVILVLPAAAWAVGVAIASIPDNDAIIERMTKIKRKLCYDLAVKCLPEDSATRPGPSFLLGYLVLSLALITIIPALVDIRDYHDYMGIVFNLLCVTFGFPAAIYFYGVSVCQNIVIRNLPPGSSLNFAAASVDGNVETVEVPKELEPVAA
jgi:uncharacterized membrane protein